MKVFLKSLIMLVFVLCSNMSFAVEELKEISENKFSKVEKYYNQKLSQKDLYQYGYNELIKRGNYVSSGGVQDDYVLGSGDEISVSLTGGKNMTYEVTVNKHGKVIFEGLLPIDAAGLKLYEFKDLLQARVSKMYLNTKSYVSLNKIRLINATILGEVAKPGAYTLNAMSKLSDLISMAGGIKKTGSLRKIIVINNGEKKVIDLYEMFAGNDNFEDVYLKHSTRVMIPTISETVAVIGSLQKESIFESSGNDELIRVIAGIDKNVSVNKTKFGKGNLIIVSDSKSSSEVVEMINSNSSRFLSINKSKYLSELMKEIDLDYKKNMYPFIGIIERFNDKNLTANKIMFNPALVLSKNREVILKQGDKITLLTKQDIESFQKEEKEDLNDIVLKHYDLLANNSVSLYGEVSQEGLYPVYDNVKVTDLIGLSGGVLPSANNQKIEVTKTKYDRIDKKQLSFNDLKEKYIRVTRGDSVVVKAKFDLVNDAGVYISGEVKYPGKYSFVRGEKLSSLIARAGGLTEESYAYGTVYSRESARIKEKEKYKQAVRNLERSLAEYIASNEDVNTNHIKYSQSLIEEIKAIKPLGRIVVEANPDALATSPEKDILLQEGDKVYVPKRSLTVHVMGEVLNPSNLKFETGKKSRDYIKEAGGYSYYADKGRGFILFPDGSSKPIKESSWDFAETSVPEGSTIIVPRDPDPYNFMESSTFITNVLSQIAITTAAISDIKD
ncbi:MAG: SLBB domain-containing protein [Alphaproteobacteria bacterium]|nr:SLBB domain-containing protein [Alphaproteobacteria bacterium]